MKGLSTLVLGVLLAGLLAGHAPVGAETSGGPGEIVRRDEPIRMLVLVSDRRGANYHLARDMFEMLGWEITLTSIDSVSYGCSWAAPLGVPPLPVDLLVTDVADISHYDCLAIPPATAWGISGHQQLVDNPDALSLVSAADDAGLAIAAWCGGTRVLAAADVLDGRKVTGHPRFAAEYAAAGAIYLGDDIPPVVDGNIVTSVRGQYYARQMAEAVASVVDSIRHSRAR